MNTKTITRKTRSTEYFEVEAADGEVVKCDTFADARAVVCRAAVTEFFDQRAYFSSGIRTHEAEAAKTVLDGWETLKTIVESIQVEDQMDMPKL